jgi:hypothetical protein
MGSMGFEKLLTSFPPALPSSSPPGDAGLTSVDQSLPNYLAPQGAVESGKRKHGRSSGMGFEDVKKMSGKAK